MKHLKTKGEFQYIKPNPFVLDTFENPGSVHVNMIAHEVTALCPVTGQPDFYTVNISIFPDKLCLESKSLKIYLGAYRQEGIFAEAFARRVTEDLAAVLKCHVEVTIEAASRGGISISSRSVGG